MSQLAVRRSPLRGGLVVQVDNIAMVFKMVEEAKIKTNFLKNTHLMDHDLKMILGARSFARLWHCMCVFMRV